MQGASRRWERQGDKFLPRAPGRNQGPQHLNFTPVKLLLDFRLPELWDDKCVLFEPQTLWSCFGSHREWTRLLWGCSSGILGSRGAASHPTPWCSCRQLPPSFHSQLPPFLRTAHLPRIAFAIFALGNISISVLWSVMSTRPFLQTLSSRKRRWISSQLQRVNTGSVYRRIFSSKYMVFNMSVTYWVFITALNGGKDPASNLVLFCWGQHLALWDTHVPGHCLYVATGLYSLKINWANFNHYGEKSHSQPSAWHSLLIYDGWVNQRVVMWTAIQKAWLPGCSSRLQRLEAQRRGLGKVG